MKLFFYTMHGRTVACSAELPFLWPRPAAPPDLVLRLELPVPASAALPDDATLWYASEITIFRTTAALVMRFADGTSFLLAHDGSSIELQAAPPHYTLGDIAAYALGTVMAIALHLQGATLLHASAVVLREKAVLFAGNSGGGKSTTAAMLQKEGYRMIADDVTEISAEIRAVPSLPAIRLWPDAVATLYGDDAIFPDRAPSWDKKIITTEAFDDDAAREIAAILFLERGSGGMRIERLAPKDGWRQLMAHSFTARLPGAEMAQRILDRTTALAERVPMFSFTPPPMDDAHALGAFLEGALEEQLR